jgi:hypothetical protein
MSSTFDFNTYLQNLKTCIEATLSRPSKENITYDILDTETNKTNKLIALKNTQKNMKIGEIWQCALGNYDTFENLKKGHTTGLDILSKERKIIAEIKNRTTSDNASSKKTNLSKLAKHKRDNPDYICIYGYVNEDTERATIEGNSKTIIHEGMEIKEYTGMELLRFILGEHTDAIIEFIKKTIHGVDVQSTLVVE